jgi:ribosomal 30S subunit maturation factor RimM
MHVWLPWGRIIKNVGIAGGVKVESSIIDFLKISVLMNLTNKQSYSDKKSLGLTISL